MNAAKVSVRILKILDTCFGKVLLSFNECFCRSKDFDSAKRLASTLDDESKETMEKLLRDREGLELFLDDQETRLNIGNNNFTPALHRQQFCNWRSNRAK